MKRRKMGARLVSILIVICMIVTLLPTLVFAETADVEETDAAAVLYQEADALSDEAAAAYSENVSNEDAEEFLYGSDASGEEIDDYLVFYELSFEMNGHGGQVPSQPLQMGSFAEEPDEPYEEGWIFEGWFKDELCTVPWNFEEDTIQGAAVLY
ncbi:MAG: InlB B-repeat-containing protein, partial [Eubacterium sp.]|nr:InlB B-repeat-containing protein [Eubacterium sp.]